MPYVRRNAEGRIESLHREHSDGATELLDARHPDVQAFFANEAGEPDAFQRLDVSFVRVIEDVIDTLIVKNIINITDLPPEAQVKLIARKSFRERVSQSSLRMFEPSDFRGLV